MGPSKIIIVVAVLAIILAGIFIYMFFLDRKIEKLRKNLEEKPGLKK